MFSITISVQNNQRPGPRLDSHQTHTSPAHLEFGQAVHRQPLEGGHFPNNEETDAGGFIHGACKGFLFFLKFISVLAKGQVATGVPDPSLDCFGLGFLLHVLYPHQILW